MRTHHAFQVLSRVTTEEVGHDAISHDLGMQFGAIERVWPSKAQPAMAMKSAPFCLTCVVADNVLECFEG